MEKKWRKEEPSKPREIVVVREYSDPNKKTWKEAAVIEALGARSFLCELKNGREWLWHEGQIKATWPKEENGTIDRTNEEH